MHVPPSWSAQEACDLFAFGGSSKNEARAALEGLTDKMSAFSTEVLGRVADKLRTAGIASVVADGVLQLEPLGCSLRCDEVEGDFHPMMRGLRMVASHEAFASPIEDQLAALGSSPQQQAEYAADVWMMSFLRPLHSFLHGNTADDPPLAMVTTGPDGELYGWHAFTTVPASTKNDLPSGRMEFMQHLVGPLNTLLVDRKPHTLKCFLMKSPGVDEPGKGTGINASCHFDDREWVQGLSQLYYLGDSWGRLDVERMRRQWFFFKPATREMLGDAWDRLAGALTTPGKPASKSWWKFWQ